VRGEAELSLLFVDEAAIADLNKRFMEAEGPTDVLAFPIDERIDPRDPAPCLGDIVVSLDRAAEEGAARGTGADEEFLTYLVHGFLHLLGHDDIDPRARKRMTAATSRLVAKFRRLPTGVSW
jgi:probable rRNA maturation factor